MTQDEERRICPHCGAGNRRSPLVTLCDECGGSFDPAGPARPTPAPPAGPLPPSLPKPPGLAPRPPSVSQPSLLAPTPEAAAGPPPATTGRRAALTLPVGVHLFLLIAGSMGGFLGLGVLGMAHSEWFEAIGIPFLPVGFFAGPLLGYLIPRLILKFVVLARCPKCSGPAVFRGGRPITYHCKSCGHVHRTSVSEGTGRRWRR